MTRTHVTRAQFEVRENEVVHKPTRARFTAYPGIAGPHLMNQSHADERLPSGEDYRLSDIRLIAEQLLAERLTTKS